jgi:hypothetical protein
VRRLFLDPPAAPAGTWGALLRQAEKDYVSLAPVGDKREFEWNTLIDPDGS